MNGIVNSNKESRAIVFWSAASWLMPLCVVIGGLILLRVLGASDGIEGDPFTRSQIAVIIGIICLAPTAFMYAQDEWNLARGRLSRGWPTASGQVLSGRVMQKKIWQIGPRTTGYWLDIAYRYVVKDREYIGDRVQFGPSTVPYPVLIEDFAARYPKGAEVNVYYDPEHPECSVLETGGDMVQQGRAMKLLGMLALCLIFLLILFFTQDPLPMEW